LSVARVGGCVFPGDGVQEHAVEDVLADFDFPWETISLNKLGAILVANQIGVILRDRNEGSGELEAHGLTVQWIR
jgi:hypothetical protein